MTDLDKHNPQFTLAMRGYDRLQVDDYIDRLRSLVADAEERARTAESELDFDRHATVGPRIAEIFDLAVAEAKELRERVDAQARTLLADAREQADRLLDEVHREAAELADRSRLEHGLLVEELERERSDREADVARLERRRQRLLGELRRLHDAIGSVAGLATSPDPELNGDGLDGDPLELETVALPQLTR